MNTHTPVHCPYCDGPMTPVALRCDACDVQVQARFVFNEFATLSEDDLHFLRIFIVCEGRIRDMEGRAFDAVPQYFSLDRFQILVEHRHNAKGELVGLLFDGTYESVSSDYLFDEVKTRSIHVDSRYMLWNMAEVDGAQRLLQEMGVSYVPAAVR